MSKLKECPFCGASADLNSPSKGFWVIQCDNCGVALEHYGSKREDAIQRWNRRIHDEDNSEQPKI